MTDRRWVKFTAVLSFRAPKTSRRWVMIIIWPERFDNILKKNIKRATENKAAASHGWHLHRADTPSGSSPVLRALMRWESFTRWITWCIFNFPTVAPVQDSVGQMEMSGGRAGDITPMRAAVLKPWCTTVITEGRPGGSPGHSCHLSATPDGEQTCPAASENATSL